MYQKAKILQYKPDVGKTQLVIEIDEDIKDIIETQKMTGCEIRFDDGRHISAEQRKKAYATINDIAEFIGDYPEYIKELMKYKNIIERGEDYISLSDCTMTEAREYINTLIDFALAHGVPLKASATDRTDDISSYLYSCLKYKRCAVCGREGEIHHCEGSRIGMGNDRTKISNKGRELICLCRVHHTECHTMSEREFFDKYKIYGLEVDFM